MKRSAVIFTVFTIFLFSGRDSGLEKDGSFIKFQGYSGQVALSPTHERRGRFRKKQRPVTMSSDLYVTETQTKKGIMAKVRLDFIGYL